MPDFAGGVHPPTHKGLAAEQAIEVLPLPERLLVPLHQHAGLPARLVGPTRGAVAYGALLGEASGPISARVHAPMAGKVAAPTVVGLPNGRRVPAVPIRRTEASEAVAFEAWREQGDADQLPEPARIVEAAEAAGVVGMGGAAFPTHRKLAVRPDRRIDTVLVNGSECEPYLCADDRLMREAPAPILRGALLAMRAVGAERGVVAIEADKHAAIERMRSALAALEPGHRIELVFCPRKYPMGGERQLVPAVLGRVVPTAGLPLDVGVLVLNVQTAAALAAALSARRPLTHRVVTVSGGGVARPANLWVPVGAPIEALLAHCGGLTGQARRVVAGGPMMGFSVTDLSVPVTKGTSGVTVLTAEEARATEPDPCIRCGRCLDVCPLRLAPVEIARASRLGALAEAMGHHLMACCECGCCAYVCPSRIPLVQEIVAGKQAVRRGRTESPA